MRKSVKFLASLILTSVILLLPLSGCGVHAGKEYEDRKFDFYSAEEIKAQRSKDKAYAYSFVTDSAAPTVFICPGGGYSKVCDGYEGVKVAEYLNSKGYNAFVLVYRIGLNADAPNPQDDLAALIKYVYGGSKFALTDQNYAVMGFSAGGHLAATFGATSTGYAHYGLPKPEVMILSYPVVTMGEDTHGYSRLNLLGTDKSLRDLYSVEKQVNADYPPTFVWCCKDDNVVKPVNSEKLSEALKTAGVKCELKEYEKGGHGIGLAEGTDAEGWLDEALRFWTENA